MKSVELFEMSIRIGMQAMQQNVVLLGFKSCGKSTVGRLLAARSGCVFADVDRAIEELYFQKTGKVSCCYDIYQEVGAPSFRLLEQETVSALVQNHSGVIACGGGAVLSEQNVSLLREWGKMVYLKASSEVLKSRVFGAKLAGSRLPAFLDEGDPEGSFYEVLAKRELCYPAVADYTINVSCQTPEQVVTHLLEMFRG